MMRIHAPSLTAALLIWLGPLATTPLQAQPIDPSDEERASDTPGDDPAADPATTEPAATESAASEALEPDESRPTGTKAAKPAKGKPKETKETEPTTSRGAQPKAAPRRRHWGVTGYPILFYSPETKAAVGGGIALFHEAPSLRPDVTETEVFLTQMGQVELELKQTTYLAGNDYKLSGHTKFTYAPNTTFWGVGNDTPDSDEEEYLRQAFTLSAAFQLMLVKDVFVGPLVSLGLFRADRLEEDGQLIQDVLTGGRDTNSVGTGLVLEWDTVDSPFFPTRGWNLKVEAVVHRTEFGSDHDFSQAGFDQRLYIPLASKHVLAFQGLATLSTANVPWQMMPELGGMSMLRGYHEGRYRDRLYAAAQAEYRFPIIWRLGGVAFAGLGEVAGAFDDFSGDALRASAGGGLRFTLVRAEHINLRTDVAVTREGNLDFYISLMEAF